MKKIILLAIAVLLLTSCGRHFTLDSYNGRFVQAISEAYEVFEETDALPLSIQVDGKEFDKGNYTLAACLLLEKMAERPHGWQKDDIAFSPVEFGDEYRWNTFDPDVIDFAHICYMADRIVQYAHENGRLPNYITFPSDNPQSPGYMPQLTMVVTQHDNRMNLRAAMVVMARVINGFVENRGKWPKEVSSWPSSYLESSPNSPADDELVKITLADALKDLGPDATDRQKAEAIFNYARDEWEWENYMNTRKGAVGTINDKGGNCCDLTHTTLAMCHAAGIPARYLHGQCYFKSGVIGHVIPEIYVDGKWWICDPSNNNATWGTPTWKGMETFNGRYYKLEF